MQVEKPCTYETMVFGYEEMILCAVNQVPNGMVKCNSCGMTHAFYQCPSLTGMDEEAQKMYFQAQALEKCNAKKLQYQVDQVYTGDDQNDQEDTDDYLVTNADMTNWTKEDWIDFQMVLLYQAHQIFDKANAIQSALEP